jgi:hypothetical protein
MFFQKSIRLGQQNQMRAYLFDVAQFDTGIGHQTDSHPRECFTDDVQP